MTLEELKENNDINIRTYNVCLSAKLNSIEDIVLFFEKNGTFLKVRNCGKQTDKELTILCERYQKDNSFFQASTSQQETNETFYKLGSLENILKNLNKNQETIIEYNIKDKILNLSTRSYTAISIFLNNDFSIKNIYSKIFLSEDFEFHKMRNIGTKSVVELEAFKRDLIHLFNSVIEVIPEKENDELWEKIQNLTTYQQLVLNADVEKMIAELPQKAYNALSKYLNNDFSIGNFYNNIFSVKNFRFTSIQNIGENTAIDLHKLSAKIINIFKTDKYFNELNNNEEILLKIHNLTVYKKSILNILIESELSKLSKRSHNALLLYLNGDTNAVNIYNKLITNSLFEFDKLLNIGAKAKIELSTVRSEFSKILSIENLCKLEELTIDDYLYYFLKKHIDISISSYKNISPILISLGQIPIFKVIDTLIKDSNLLNEKQREIFINYFDYFLPSKIINLKTISHQIGLSQERIRQLRKDLYFKFLSYFSFLHELDLNSFCLYEIDFHLDLIFVSDSLVEIINDKEKINFNKLFINKIISFLSKGRYFLIGPEKNLVFNYQPDSTHNWKSTYVIKKNKISIFDFTAFIEDIAQKLDTKIEETYYLNFQPYLLNFYSSEDFSQMESISSICEKMLFEEFSLILDTNNSIIFERNTTKAPSEYIIDLLEQEGRPLSVYEMFDLLNTEDKNIFKTPDTLRSTCLKMTNSDLIYFGRSSTYGLRKWEDGDNGIKGGTIRSIAEEYLLKHDQPINIDDIFIYIIKFRNTTNMRSVIHNLKSDQYNRFVFFESGFIGLTTKNYEGCNLALLATDSRSSRRSWRESMDLFWQFLKNNNRMPISNGSEEEMRLYRFFKNQEKATRLNELNSKQTIEFIELKKHIETEEYPSTEWLEGFEKYKLFFKKNKRSPIRSMKNETTYYNWYYKQITAFKNNLLSTKQISLLKEVGVIL